MHTRFQTTARPRTATTMTSRRTCARPPIGFSSASPTARPYPRNGHAVGDVEEVFGQPAKYRNYNDKSKNMCPTPVATYIVMAHIVMAHIVMAYIVMAHIVMAYSYGPTPVATIRCRPRHYSWPTPLLVMADRNTIHGRCDIIDGRPQHSSWPTPS